MTAQEQALFKQVSDTFEICNKVMQEHESRITVLEQTMHQALDLIAQIAQRLNQ